TGEPSRNGLRVRVLPVVDELDTDVAEGEPADDHLVRDRERVVRVAVAAGQVRANLRERPVRKNDLEGLRERHARLVAKVFSGKLDSGQDGRGGGAVRRGTRSAVGTLCRDDDSRTGLSDQAADDVLVQLVRVVREQTLGPGLKNLGVTRSLEERG